jgi:hypothetical protein
MNLHRFHLATHCEFFYKLFTFGEKKTSYELIVDDADIMRDIIMTFYGAKMQKSSVATYKCRNYLCLPNDIDSLYEMEIPPEDFYSLIEILAPYDLSTNRKLVHLVRKNLPCELTEASIRNFFNGTDNDDLISEIIRKDKLCTFAYGKNSLCVYNLETKEAIQRYVETKEIIQRNINCEISCIAILSDSTKIVYGTGYNIGIYDIASDQNHRVVVLNPLDNITCVSVTANNKMIISGGDNGTIKIFDLESMQELATITAFSLAINCLAVSSDNKIVASSGACFKIWKLNDILSGQYQNQEYLTDYFISNLLFSSDNTEIVVSNNNMINIWNINSTSIVDSWRFAKCICSVALSPNGVYLVVQLYCHWLMIINRKTGVINTFVIYGKCADPIFYDQTKIMYNNCGQILTYDMETKQIDCIIELTEDIIPNTHVVYSI